MHNPSSFSCFTSFSQLIPKYLKQKMNTKPLMLSLFLTMLFMSATARPVTDHQSFNEETNAKEVLKKVVMVPVLVPKLMSTKNLQPFNGAFIVEELKRNVGCTKWCPRAGPPYIYCCG
ncbi:hypothetical protein QN277_016636 [Acacia crassicarpa]|uniref:Uncharacterized protein n=1 Tax=Acacia crassicarpa TaxID=499986 RepID=A0AAE1MX27_9FABA|nr:hypothetical protein QN277_016636 [Acacia crassicarpa]